MSFENIKVGDSVFVYKTLGVKNVVIFKQIYLLELKVSCVLDGYFIANGECFSKKDGFNLKGNRKKLHDALAELSYETPHFRDFFYEEMTNVAYPCDHKSPLVFREANHNDEYIDNAKFILEHLEEQVNDAAYELRQAKNNLEKFDYVNFDSKRDNPNSMLKISLEEVEEFFDGFKPKSGKWYE